MIRYNGFLTTKFDRWSQDEDIRLFKAVQNLGVNIGTRDWVNVAKEVPPRSRAQCRLRFHNIMKMYNKNPDGFSWARMDYPEKDSLQKKRQEEFYKRLNAKWKEFLNGRTDGNEDEDSDGDESETEEVFKEMTLDNNETVLVSLKCSYFLLYQ